MIPHNRPTFGPEEAEAAARVLASNWVAPGPEVRAFENELCAFLGLEAGLAVAVSSGSAALFLALHGLAAKNRRIAIPAYACNALANAAHWASAQAEFCDCAKGGLTLNAGGVLADGVALAIPVASFGIPPALPSEGRERLILDLAQAIGSEIDGMRLPHGIACAVLSFSATKLMTAGGQGGAIVSRDRGLMEAIRDFVDFDNRHDRQPRFNFLMTDLQAAIGRCQLTRLPGFMARRDEVFSQYQSAGLPMIDGSGKGIRPVRYRAVMRTDTPAQTIEALGRAGVRAIVPIEIGELPAEPEAFPEAARLCRTTISLPIYPTLTPDDIARIIDVLSRVR